MLSLTPAELRSDAERHLLEALTALGTGRRVQGGLAVFVPVVDGAMQRRQADALVFLPETLVVVRAAGMGRQSGELVPQLNGAWSIGTEVLRLAGGGSTPAPQLERATAVLARTLRAAGLDPGGLPGLAIIDGAVSSVRHRDVAGPIACRMDAGDLLTGLRRCAALGTAADSRVWTTADVRAALEVFGVRAPLPSVEELNGEGFFYSPYVLRHCDPVGAASMPAEPVVDAVLVIAPAAIAPAPAVAPTPRVEQRSVRRRVRVGAVARVLSVLAAVCLAGIAIGATAGQLIDQVGPLTAVAQQTPAADRTAAGGTSSGATSAAATSPAGPLQTLAGSTFELAVSRADDDCAANAYGAVADFFQATPCRGLHRGLFTTTIEGQPAMVWVSDVTMPDAGSAAELRALTDTSGMGNVSALRGQGVRIGGVPGTPEVAAYASELSDHVVRIVEVSWSDPGDTGQAGTLEVVATDALQLELPN